MESSLQTFTKGLKDELRRVELLYNLEKVKVIVIEDIPLLELHFTDNGTTTFGPHKKDNVITVPVWLMRILKASGHVVLHKDERTDEFFQPTKERVLAPISKFFFNKSFDWLDTVEKLAVRGLVSAQAGKLTRSRFTSFLDVRFKKLIESIAGSPYKKLEEFSLEEQAIAKRIQVLVAEWERLILKKEK